MNTQKHHSIIRLYIVLLFLFVGNAHAQVLIDSIIAVVNKQAITQSELIDEFRIDNIIGKPTPQKPTATDKRRYLDQIIRRKLVLQGAEKIGITTGDYSKQVAERIGEIRAKFRSDTDFQNALQKQKLEIKALEKWVYEHLIYDVYFNRQFFNRVDRKEIDELAPQYFEANKAQFVTPATVTFRSILISVPPDAAEEEKQSTKLLAEQISSRLERGDTYDQIEQSSKSNTSIIFGTLTLTTDTPLGTIVSQLELTGRKGPIHVPEGFQFVELIKKTNARQKAYSEVKDEIGEMLQQNMAETEFNKWLARQKSGVPWYIVDGALKRVTRIQVPPTK